jgi:hypothetical protein
VALLYYGVVLGARCCSLPWVCLCHTSGDNHLRSERTFDWGSLESLGQTLVGPFEYRFRERIVGGVLVAAVMLFYVSWSRTGGEVAVGAQVAQKLQRGQSILGSAQLVAPQVFKKRWAKPDHLGLTLKGRFWGRGGKFLGTQFCLDGEDVARGIAAFGAQGSGKTQAVILPTFWRAASCIIPP